MKKILTAVVFGLAVLVSLPAKAGTRDYRYGVDHGGRQHTGSNYNRYHHYNNNNSNNEWKYAVGGLIVGAVLANKTQKQQQQQPQPQQVIVYNSPRPYPVQTCITRDVYDQYGNKISSVRECY